MKIAIVENDSFPPSHLKTLAPILNKEMTAEEVIYAIANANVALVPMRVIDGTLYVDSHEAF